MHFKIRNLKSAIRNKKSAIRNILAAALLALVVVSGPTPVVTMSEDDLIGTLLLTPDEADRRQILEKNKELVNQNLVWKILSFTQFSYASGDKLSTYLLLDIAYQIAVFLDDEYAKAKCLLNKGHVQTFEGNIDNALELLDEACGVFHNMKGQQAEISEALCLSYKALAYQSIGNINMAIQMNQRAISVFRKYGYTPYEAECLTSMGIIYYMIGDFQKSIEMTQAAIQIYNKLGEAGVLGEANCLLIQGNVFLHSGDYDGALKIFDRSLNLYKKLGYNHPLGIVQVLISAGNTYLLMGKPDSAIEMFNNALSIFEEANVGQQQKAHCYVGLASAYLVKKDNISAFQMYERAQSIYQQINDNNGKARCYMNIGSLHYFEGNFEQALVEFENAFPIFQIIGANQGLMWTQYWMGKSRRALGDFGKALDEYTLALEHGEFLFARAGGEEMQRGVKEKQVVIYEETADLLLEMGRPEDALDVLERMRGAVLRGMLERGRVDPLARAPEDVRDKAAALTADINAINNKLVLEMQQPGGGDKDALDALRQQQLDATREFDMLMTQAAAAYASVGASGAGTKALGRDAIRAGLEPGTLLLEYFIGENRAAVFALTRDSFNMYEISCDRKQITNLVDIFYSNVYRAKDEIKTNALFACILAPVEKEILEAQSVIIVPDRELHYVPFDALAADVTTEPLFGPDRTYTVSVSGTMFLADRARAASAQRDFTTETVLALGGADFGTPGSGGGPPPPPPPPPRGGGAPPPSQGGTASAISRAARSWRGPGTGTRATRSRSFPAPSRKCSASERCMATRQRCSPARTPLKPMRGRGPAASASRTSRPTGCWT